MEDSYKRPSQDNKMKLRLHILNSRKENRRWIFTIILLSFFLSASLSFISSNIMQQVSTQVAILVLFCIIFINIAFDIIGTAVTAADEAPFHAMASRKLFGAKEAIRLIRNADKVSNFCNDVVGDICGIISGTAGAYIIVRLSVLMPDLKVIFLDLLVAATIAAFTVGGKAIGKSLAIENCNYILYRTGFVVKLAIGLFEKKNMKNNGKNKKVKPKADERQR